MSISKKACLDFSRKALLLYIIFPKINRKPNNSKTERGKRHIGPPGQPRGEELPCRFLSHPVTLSRSGYVLVIPKGTCWAPGAAPCEEDCLAGSSLSRDLVTDWAHPGGSRHISVIVHAILELLFMETLKFSPFCHFCLSKYYPGISRQTCFLNCLH